MKCVLDSGTEGGYGQMGRKREGNVTLKREMEGENEGVAESGGGETSKRRRSHQTVLRMSGLRI